MATRGAREITKEQSLKRKEKNRERRRKKRGLWMRIIRQELLDQGWRRCGQDIGHALAPAFLGPHPEQDGSFSAEAHSSSARPEPRPALRGPATEDLAGHTKTSVV